MQPGGSMLHSQGLSNNPYPEESTQFIFSFIDDYLLFSWRSLTGIESSSAELIIFFKYVKYKDFKNYKPCLR